MPLSEHEQRLLEQMEQQLLSDDPRFASTMRGPRRPGGGRRSLVIGAVVAVVGLGMLISSVTFVSNDRTWAIWLGVLAFLVMLGGILFAVSGAGGPQGEAPPSGPPRPGGRGGPTGVIGPDGRNGPRAAPRPGKQRGQGTFMQRLEQRWDRRRDDRWS